MAIEKVIEIEDKKYKFIMPTLGDVTDSDTEYSKAYIKALKDGLPPRNILEKQLRESGVLNEKEDIELAEASTKLQDIFVQFKSESDKEKKEQYKLQLMEIQNKLIQITTQRQMLFVHTAESKGEEAKMTNLSWKCIYKEDGKRLWETKELYLNERSTKAIEKIIQEFIIFMSGYDESAKLIENIMEEKEDLETQVVLPEVDENGIEKSSDALLSSK